MALVDYSGSESSEEESSPKKKEVLSKSKPTSNKPGFRKVVDSSNPHRIRVTLPDAPKVEGSSDDSEPPSKRAKLGSGNGGGFNALLPAPKRSATTAMGSSRNTTRNGGLGSGINLRTGAAPGFSREVEPVTEAAESEEAADSTTNVNPVGHGGSPAECSNKKETIPSVGSAPEVSKPKGKITMFKPLSVARKPQKKKPLPLSVSNLAQTPSGSSLREAKSFNKTSLFPSGELEDKASNGHVTKGPYQPLVFQNDVDTSPYLNDDISPAIEPDKATAINTTQASPPEASQSLDAIASDLNLSSAAKRQLLGRQKNNASAISVVNFNTDEEYKANEVARQSGEQIQHNPVRAIAPGKHSLKQLVNMGTMQADALEESFASGRRNRNEAGSKYGW